MAIFVNGEKIDPAMLEQEMESMRSKYQEAFPEQEKEEQETQLRKWARENAIEKILIKQKALADPQPVSPVEVNNEYQNLVNTSGSEEAFLEQAGLTENDKIKVKKDIEGQIKINRLVETIRQSAEAVTEQDAMEFFRQHQSDFMAPEQVHAAHIVVHTDANTSVMEAKTQILKLEEEMKNGRSFEEVADQNSDCPGNGGSLGYFPRGEMVQSFDDVVFSMHPHQISSVFQTEFGFHIAKVYDKRSAELVPFEKVKDEIIQKLYEEKQEQQIEQYLDKLLSQAEITETEDDDAQDPFPIVGQHASNFTKPLNSVLIKPSGPDCNLDCTYCFYLEKAELFPENKVHRMSLEILEEMVKQIMTQGGKFLSFGWQGGEPTLMGLPFFEKAVEFQKKYGRAQTVGNGLQTNGLLLDEKWAGFLGKNDFLVGLSLDGPEHIHDKYRVKKGGQGSWQKVVDSARLLLENDVAVNALTVVNDYSVQFPEQIYDFHKSLGLIHHQYISCIETDPTDPGKAASYSVSPKQYGEFLCKLFDLWLNDFKDGKPTTSIRYFDSVFHNYVNMPAPECTLMQECGVYVVVEHNGDIYSCDFFVEPEWKLGNVMQGNIIEFLNSDRQKEFGEMKAELPQKCKDCQWLQYCWGGCTKDRLRDPNDNNLSHFCESYIMFFEHADKDLRRMATEWLDQQKQAQTGAEVQNQESLAQARVGPNDPCPCGSGNKYKKCCGLN